MCICANIVSAKGESVAVETIQLPDGGRYVGEINGRGQPHGSGTKFRADGSEVASGQWRDGKLHGRGKMILLNCDRYEGEFVAGKWNGLGKFTRADGRVYEGEFKDDAFSGFGIQWTARGEVDECGRWVNSELVESRPVPRIKLPVGTIRNAAGEPPALPLPRQPCADRSKHTHTHTHTHTHGDVNVCVAGC